jgi:hypothetical protein
LQQTGKIFATLGKTPLGKPQRLHHRARGAFIIREQVRCVFVRPSSPIGPRSARFERTHLDAERGYCLGERLSESPNRPLGGMVPTEIDKGRSLRVAVVVFVIIVIFFALALVFLFVFFLGWLFSNEDIGSHRPIRRF